MRVIELGSDPTLVQLRCERCKCKFECTKGEMKKATDSWSDPDYVYYVIECPMKFCTEIVYFYPDRESRW